LNESQAVAARGQIELMTAWKNEFKKYKKQVAQVLLSPSDIKNKKSSNHAIATLENILDFNCVPIINENDTTSTDEIKFGDNDILAAQIATLIKADHLILLSNVDGLYKEPPKINKNDDLIKEVKSITNKIRDMAGVASKLGKGGMISKIKAAEICMKSKCSVIITSGLKENPIMSLGNKKTKSTKFIAK
ncbi:glutamate 5-kinase, partial [Gammaproteobacteria bacterium]|nr:glutamate 5-kinase [Gammaproteobacteria bacterium]